MDAHSLFAFLPETLLLLGALGLFVVCLGEGLDRLAARVSLGVAGVALIGALLSLGREAVLFSGAYQVDAFSQWLKVVIVAGYGFVLLLSRGLEDIRPDCRSEFYLFLAVSVTGLCLAVSAIDLVTLVVSLELSSFPLYLLVPMRRERTAQRTQMESAIKYIMFGVAANGVMFFGLSYLYGLTGTTSLPLVMERLQPVVHTPLAIAGLVMTFAGLYYKLAVFPFHFWTPDVYQGASNETAGLIASLPKVGAVAVLVRLVSLASPEHQVISTLLAGLAVASMFYGNLIALTQKDLKRLLGFSGIAHAGYALIGFVAADAAGYTAALYYITAYLFMVLACFAVICRVSPDGTNVPMEALGGLHRRSPLLAATLGVGVFALAGLPPFAGFLGKLALLKAALAQGYLALVILAVVNSAIAIYYYLCVIREAFFREAGEVAPIQLDFSSRVLCGLLILGVVGLGVAPGRALERISSSVGRALRPQATLAASGIGGGSPVLWSAPEVGGSSTTPLPLAD